MWILLSLIYSLTNALYLAFNQRHRFNGYVLGMWRGFGIAGCIFPLLFTIELPLSAAYYMILVLQGIMIGIYDSHIFFASAAYGANTTSGFMATTVLVTTFLWWGIDISSLAALAHTPIKLISLFLVLCGFSVCYWQMMKVHVSKQAEAYLYPATFALAVMSIATRYIALHGGSAYAGVVCYLVVACFVSGLYNLIMYLKTRKNTQTAPQISIKQALWLIFFSTILISAKTLALRLASNPGYVVALLLLSPLFARILEKNPLVLTPAMGGMLGFLVALLMIVF